MSAPTRSRAPHVLLVTPGFPPARGGVEEHVGRLAEELVSLGWRVTVLTARRGARRTVVEEWHGCRVVVAPAWAGTALSVSPRLLVRALLAGGDVDVLHVHSYHALAGLAVLNPRLRGRVVFTPHYHGGGHSPLARLLHVGYRRLGNVLFGAAQAVVCVSEAERAVLVADVPSVAGRTEVVPNGVSVEAVRAAVPFEGEPPTVLTVGRLEPYKGVARVVAAMQHVPAPAQLVVVGDGSQRAALVEQAARLGLADRVRVLGGVETTELHRWLRTARVLVSASEHEAFGMAPLEAAAAGAAVVLSDIPAHREITANHLGDAATLVGTTDADALAVALRARLDAPGRVEVEVPGWPAIAAATAAVYRRVVETRAVGTGRPVGLLDRPWSENWSVAAVGPLTLPTPDELRAVLARFLVEHPDDPRACTVVPGGRRWRPVPPADRAAHVDRVVRTADAFDPAEISAYVEAHLPPLASDLVFTCVLSPSTLVVYSRHQNGDGATFADQVLALARGDGAALAALEPRGALPLVGRALLHQPREVWAGWARHGLTGLPVPGRRTPVVATVPDAPAGGRRPLLAGPVPRPAAADLAMTNAQLRALTKWRNEHVRGASVNAVLTMRVQAALRAEGVPLRRDAFYSLFDLRPLLGDEGFTPGNLAKSVLVEADLDDPRAVDEALKATMGSRRALPALAIGAVRSAVARPAGPGPDGGSAPTEAVLSFSSMPSLAGLEGLPWSATEGRRYVGFGYPMDAAGVSVFAIRFRDRLELSASFDRALADPAAVGRALRRVAEGDPGD